VHKIKFGEGKRKALNEYCAKSAENANSQRYREFREMGERGSRYTQLKNETSFQKFIEEHFEIKENNLK
jgi:hypothetical protein